MSKLGANGECVETEFNKSDYITHHNDFVNACEIAMDQASKEGRWDDVSYWGKQIRTLERLKNDYHS